MNTRHYVKKITDLIICLSLIYCCNEHSALCKKKSLTMRFKIYFEFITKKTLLDGVFFSDIMDIRS